MPQPWEKGASAKLQRYGYVVIPCANFASRAGYRDGHHSIFPEFVRRAAGSRLHISFRQPSGRVRVLGTLELGRDEDITASRCRIIQRHAHTGHRLDVLVVCGQWQAGRFFEDHEQRMESGGLLRYMLSNRHLYISQYSMNPHSGTQQEVQLGVLAGGMLHDDYELGTMWMDHDDGLGEFFPEHFLLLQAHRDGYRGVLAVPVIARLRGSERVMPPDVSRFEITSADHDDYVTALSSDEVVGRELREG
jgi:hypothetical protein